MSKNLGILINKIANQLKRKMDKEMNENYNLTKTQSLVLSYINSNKEIYQKDIEKRFSIRRSTATEILNLMEKRNLIKRTPSKIDKRLNNIEITEEGIKLEKVDPKQNCRVDENFAVIVGKCQTTGHRYLIKYAKRIKPSEVGDLRFNVRDFKLVGAYPVDGEMYDLLSGDSRVIQKINTAELFGFPTCPCCGNQFGFVVCGCGNIFCVGDDPHTKCPWCGVEGFLHEGVEGLNVNRARG